MSRKKHKIMADLKPCPFCATADGHTHWANDPMDGLKGMIHQVNCGRCGCDGPPGSSLANAATLWNARPSADGKPPKYIQKLNKKRDAFLSSQ